MHTVDKKCRCFSASVIISGILFAIIAFIHLLRSIMGWTIFIEGELFPIWASILVAVVTGVMAIWDFCLIKKCPDKCARHKHGEHEHLTEKSKFHRDETINPKDR